MKRRMPVHRVGTGYYRSASWPGGGILTIAPDLEKLLPRKWWPLADLALELNASPVTTLRALRWMRDVGYPVQRSTPWGCRERGVKFTSPRGAKLPSFRITSEGWRPCEGS